MKTCALKAYIQKTKAKQRKKPVPKKMRAQVLVGPTHPSLNGKEGGKADAVF